jgi:integrase
MKEVKNFLDILEVANNSPKLTPARVTEFKNAVCALYSNLNTQITYVSRLKKTLENSKYYGNFSPLTKKAIKSLVIDSNSKRENYSKKLWESGDNISAIVTISREQFEAILSKLNPDIYAIAYAIISCGRRPSEILNATFEIAGENLLKVSGLSKKRSEAETVVIPTIFPTDTTIKAIEKARKLILFKLAEKEKDYSYCGAGISKKDVENRFTATFLNKECSNAFAAYNFENTKNITPKTLRALYANYLAIKNQKGLNVYFDGRVMTVQNFYSRVLGHKEGDANTMRSYFTAAQII